MTEIIEKPTERKFTSLSFNKPRRSLTHVDTIFTYKNDVHH